MVIANGGGHGLVPKSNLRSPRRSIKLEGTGLTYVGFTGMAQAADPQIARADAVIAEMMRLTGINLAWQDRAAQAMALCVSPLAI